VSAGDVQELLRLAPWAVGIALSLACSLGLFVGWVFGYGTGAWRTYAQLHPRRCGIISCGKPAAPGSLMCAWHRRTHEPHLRRHLTRAGQL